jgi:catecholate siderophore receptor
MSNTSRPVLLPLGALAAGFGLFAAPAFAQTVAAPAAPASAAAPAEPGAATLPAIKVKAAVEKEPPTKQSYQTTQTRIGKGQQELRDIPQSITVVTERLMDDRNLDTLKDALHNTAGITFMAAEGGEEDIRLRGFSLAATGDIFVDGMRDPAFYDRDTFNNDSVELLRGSASMLFGRGSTGGAVNQVSKQPLGLNRNEVAVTLGNAGYARATGDFNTKTGEDAAFRLNVMSTAADNHGNKIEKYGIAPTFRWGIGQADEFSVGIYVLDNKNGINYGMPWVPVSIDSRGDRLLDVPPSAYYGMGSDYNAGSASYGTVSHTHRFEGGGELRTIVRHGSYDRDQRASTVRIRPTNALPGVCQTPFVSGTSGPRVAAIYAPITNATELCRGTNNKVQDMETTYAQSDYSGKLSAFGLAHEVQSGVDLAKEDFNNYNMVLPTGVTLTKPLTTIGAPNDGATVDESLRQKSLARSFEAQALGLYAQDLVQVAPSWKVLAGLRYDRFKGEYFAPAAGTTAAVTRQRSDGLWSKRVGVLYQPDETASFHASWGTSFNTSGDTYQYDNQTENTPPEGSVNLELGAKIDSDDGNFTTRMAIFRSTKLHERNRDPDSAATANLLSGKRHTAGIELDITGRLTKAWEVYGSYAWTPVARIDVGAPGSVAGVGEGEGTRSSLTPRHSGTVWTTYQLTPVFRFGAGLNARSSQTPNRNPGFAAPKFVAADLMAEATIDKSSALKLNVTNLTNKLYADALYTGHYIPGAPRTVQVTMSARF